MINLTFTGPCIVIYSYSTTNKMYLFHLVPASSCLTYACCRMCSFELLMMEGKTVRNMQSVFFVALQPNAGHSVLILEVSRSHTTTHHSRQDFSGRMISQQQIPLLDNTERSQQRDIHCPRPDSNPQSQQASGRRPTPQNARPPGPAQSILQE